MTNQLVYVDCRPYGDVLLDPEIFAIVLQAIDWSWPFACSTSWWWNQRGSPGAPPHHHARLGALAGKWLAQPWAFFFSDIARVKRCIQQGFCSTSRHCSVAVLRWKSGWMISGSGPFGSSTVVTLGDPGLRVKHGETTAPKLDMNRALSPGTGSDRSAASSTLGELWDISVLNTCSFHQCPHWFKSYDVIFLCFLYIFI